MRASLAIKPHQRRESERERFLGDVLEGLSAGKKKLNPKYFYDTAGSQLFERITSLPEYYITRTETQLMKDLSGKINTACAGTQAIVEFGSGSGRRSQLLLDALPQVKTYVPVDVSAELLQATARDVHRVYPQIDVQGLVADFTAEIEMPAGISPQRLGYFPGSTIGNFAPAEAVEFLTRARRLLGPQARMLIGVDLTKPVQKLENAYNDDQGVTAAFNLNVLRRINTELDADFDLSGFRHQAFFEPHKSRIEMHLVSLEKQQVMIDGEHCVDFRRGETIHTENSYKYSLDGFRELAGKANWRPAQFWTDAGQLFSLHLLEYE